MKNLAVPLLTLTLVFTTMAVGFESTIDLEDITAYGYLRKIGVPLAKKMRKAEELVDQIPNRIVGGEYTCIDYFPYQVQFLFYFFESLSDDLYPRH